MADDKYLNLEGLTHFKEKLDDTFAEKGDLDSKQDTITETNKLDYALIDNTPALDEVTVGTGLTMDDTSISVNLADLVDNDTILVQDGKLAAGNVGETYTPGDGITISDGAISVNVDGETIKIEDDTLTVDSLDVEEIGLDNNTLQIINGKLTVVLPIFDGEEVQ